MAQRVLSGSIRSIQDKSPLIGVTIQIEHTSIGTTTDEQGNYVLKNIPIGKMCIRDSLNSHGEATIQR